MSARLELTVKAPRLSGFGSRRLEEVIMIGQLAAFALFDLPPVEW
jgi:hypothetical protein